MRVDVSVFRESHIPDSSLDHYCQYVTRLRQPSLRRVLSAERKPEGVVLVCPALPKGWNWVDHLALPLTIDEACSVAYSLARAFDYLHAVGFRGALQISPSEQFAFYKDPAGLDLTVFPPEPRHVFLNNPDTAACGTPAYMPPEFGQATPASDSYGLAALLHLLLTGETMIALGGNVQETISRILRGDFVRLGERRPDLPRPLTDFVDRVTSREPGERPALREWAARMREFGGHLLPQPHAASDGGLSQTLDQAAVLAARGDVEGAMELLWEQEHKCREMRNKEGLSACLGSQGAIIAARGDSEQAVRLLREQERICHELGDNEGLLSCLRRQCEIHSSRGDESSARVLLSELERMERERRSRGALTITHALGRGAFGDRFEGEYTVPAAAPGTASDTDADPDTPVETRLLDTVCFSVTTPRALAPNRSCVIDAWIHLRESVEDVVALARENQQFVDIDIRTKTGVRVRRGSLLTARLRIDGLVIDDPEDELPWNGQTANASFVVRVPREAATGDYPGQCTFHFDGMRIAKLPFVLRVGDAAKEVSVKTVEGYRSAFASYSRKDTAEVFARIQGLMKALPQLDIFIDVASLRSGDRWQEKLDEAIAKRDTFYLFWSKNACESPYVEREWRHALAVKGLDAIEPVPLVSPLEVPPPRELADKHFDDWVLSFMRARN